MNNDEMILREFIIRQSDIFKKTEEEWNWETVERDTFEKVYDFMQRKGWIISSELIINKINACNEYRASLEVDSDMLIEMEQDIYLSKFEEIECREEELEPEAKEIYCFFKRAMGYY